MIEDSIRSKFEQFDREAFADWLWKGLLSFYTLPASKRSSVFDEMGYLILQQESLCEGLAHIYESCVPAPKQLLFRQAIGDVLREQGSVENAPTDAFSNLIYLIARIKATESLNALPPTVGSGLLGKQKPDIFFDAFAILRLLAPSAYAYETAYQLINSVNFDDGYLFEAINVLVECDPTHTAEVIRFFEPRLSDLRQATETLGGEEWQAFLDVANDWIVNILKLGSISWLNEFWEKASHSVNQLWLFELIFANENSLAKLIYDVASDEFFIKNGAKKVPLKVSDKDYWTRRHLMDLTAIREIHRWSNDPDDPVNEIFISSLLRGSAMSHHLGTLIARSSAFLFGQPRPHLAPES